MSVQSNTPSSSDASASEQTVKPFYVSLDIEPGQDLEILCWALTTLREKFYNDAADELASRSVSGFVEATQNIGTVNEFLGEITRQLSVAYRQLSTIQGGSYLQEEPINGKDAQWLAQEKQYAERFGWNK